MQQYLYQSPIYSVTSKEVIEGAYHARAISDHEILSNYPLHSADGTDAAWKLQEDISAYPVFHANAPLLSAVYNMTLEELKKNTTADGVYNTGARWPGVWTRDISYSVFLSLAMVDPARAKESLLRKVKRDRIIQDTGTGGAWPCSSDREVWSIAAWEVYLVTGDRAWLRQSEQIIANSIEDDALVVFDPVTGLARGESSFLDWREQTYPAWMEPADIFESKNLGTNVVFYRTYRILAEMNRELGSSSEEWDKKADALRAAIEKHFAKHDGSYGQYLYGRSYQTLSTRFDALANALILLSDIPSAEQKKQIIKHQPYMAYGVPTVYPQSPGLQPYHNQSVWPFVQAFWNLAATQQNDTGLLQYGLASMYRASALFLTNKENFIVDSGNPVGTAVNSDRQLWSVAGSLSMVYRVLFGMNFETDGIHFSPVIPKSFVGPYELSNFHYRDAVLHLSVKGYGTHIRTYFLDGKEGKPVFPVDMHGAHTIQIEMDNADTGEGLPQLRAEAIAPDVPTVTLDSDQLHWKEVPGAKKYGVYQNGKLLTLTSTTSLTVRDHHSYSAYQVNAVSESGIVSFLSEPVVQATDGITYPVSNEQPYLSIEQQGTTGLVVSGKVAHKGRYQVTFRYANGSGPMDSKNMCAIRTLFVDGKRVGTVVMPQRGKEAWDVYGWSNQLSVALIPGTHQFELRLLPEDTNMNGVTNHARVSDIKLTLF